VTFSDPQRQAGPEAGFTMIEVIVAMALALIMIGGFASGMIRNEDSSISVQRDVSLISVAQAQVENVRRIVTQYGFSALAMNAYPTAPTGTPNTSTLRNPGDPDDFVQNDGMASAAYLIENNFNNVGDGTIGGGTTYSEPLYVNTTSGKISPGPVVVTAGSGTADVYTYVTAVPSQCTGTGCGSNAVPCATACADDVLRVIVAVKLISPGSGDTAPTAPTYTETVMANPVPSSQSNTSSGLRLGLNLL
jgi:prepilin-type N-terminal cleavage/methylation domain-containing protein